MIDKLKCLSDENRLRILSLVNQCPFFVSDICQILAVNQSNTSRHLDRLYREGLVEKRQCGQSVCFYANPKLDKFVIEILLEFKNQKQYMNDQKSMEQLIKLNPESISKMKEYRVMKGDSNE